MKKKGKILSYLKLPKLMCQLMVRTHNAVIAGHRLMRCADSEAEYYTQEAQERLQEVYSIRREIGRILFGKNGWKEEG